MRAPSLEAFAAPAGRIPERQRVLVDGLVVAYGLAWAAGSIHLVAALEHVEEHLSFAIFFALLGCAQLLWGVGLHRSPTRRLLVTGATVSLAVVALWAISRTTGIPIGPDSGRPEPVAALDSLASADEVLLALLVGLRLGCGRSGRAPRYLNALGVVLMLLSAVSLTQLGHVH